MSPNSPITLVAVVSAIPGIERRISYSGRGLANSINCSKICSRRFVNLISSCALYLTSSIIGEVFEWQNKIALPVQLTSQPSYLLCSLKCVLYVQSDEDTLPKVDEVSKTEAQTFNIFDKLIGPLQFCM